ncbi:cytochrome P450, partial [Nocardia sp. NPDC060220]|uniref:cytochrome P450 n=1 Tax=Nocardia sp. NPDC060220 TaxID=3347076 RepID=UPI00364F201B
MAVSKTLPLAIGDQRHRRAPGPPALPLAGALYGAGYLLGGEGLGHKLFDYYGPIVAVPILGFGRVVLVNDPELVKQVFLAKPDVLLGGEGVGPAAAIYGDSSMFVLEEPEHLRRRRLLTPPLHGDALRTYVPIVAAATRSAMASWPTGQPFSLLRAARAMTLDVIVRVIFGIDDPAEIRKLGNP